MRRILGSVIVVAAVVALVTLGTGAKDTDDGNARFVAELDNAFGMTVGGDLKIAGVRAGKITKLTLDRRTKHALVQFEVTKDGFDSLRTDATCETRPQSLIGEYFLDCDPGRAATKLGDDGRIPIEHTTTTVGPDLVNTILRKPYAQRLSIILNELGAAVGGNEENLNDAIRRASPALRETDKVLAILARQNQTIQSLITNADTVVGDLAGNRRDISRWIDEAGNTARISATRRQQIAEGFQRLPAFLEELGPTMDALGRASDAQTPALQDLDAASGQLKVLFDRLVPFSRVSRPATRGLGKASDVGRTAVKAATPVVSQLQRSLTNAPEATTNLAIVLEHLEDPKFTPQYDERAAVASGRPMPTGYSGLEGLLQYVYDQAVSTNTFDANNHLLKIGVAAGGNCAPYADAARARQFGEECASMIGPHQPGVNFTDLTGTGADPGPQTRAKRSPSGDGKSGAAAPSSSGDGPAAGGGGSGGSDTGSGGGSGGSSGGASTPAIPVGPVTVPGVPIPVPQTGTGLPLGIGQGTGVGTGVGQTGKAAPDDSRNDLLDFLLGS